VHPHCETDCLANRVTDCNPHDAHRETDRAALGVTDRKSKCRTDSSADRLSHRRTYLCSNSGTDVRADKRAHSDSHSCTHGLTNCDPDRRTDRISDMRAHSKADRNADPVAHLAAVPAAVISAIGTAHATAEQTAFLPAVE
jgi:hypothetical protein